MTAVTKGTSPSGQHYYPAFPYSSYTHAKVEDVRDLFAYIKTLPPISGRVDLAKAVVDDRLAMIGTASVAVAQSTRSSAP